MRTLAPAGQPSGALPRTDPVRGSAATARRPQALHSPRWLLGFVIFEFACQLALLIPSISPLRTAVRVGAFGGSLVVLFLLRSARQKHPASSLALCIVAILIASLANPETDGVLSGVATILLALSVLAPIFWVPTLRIDATTVRHLFLLLWAFNTASAVFGALQVYFPGQFQPAPANVYSDEAFAALHITLANGARVPRPMGLTDTPGGAGIGAVYTVLLGLAFLLARPRALFRAVLIGSMVIACFALYLTQIRALVVMLVISLLAMVTVSASSRRLGRTVLITLIVLGAGSAGLAMALSIGGDAVSARLSTLLASDPQSIYYSNRGFFLEHTFVDLLPEYPLGAGLGRYGMMNTHFGSNSSRPIWAEIQWTAWLLDGGLPLVIVYSLAMLVAFGVAVRIARRALVDRPDLLPWACSLVGCSIGTIALTFSTAPFVGTGGLEFWLLNATLFAASEQRATSAFEAS